MAPLVVHARDGSRLVLTAAVEVTGKPQFKFKDNSGKSDKRDTIAGSCLY